MSVYTLRASAALDNSYDACVLTTGPTITNYAIWEQLKNNGKFNITINGTEYTINPDFSSDGSMSDVATSLNTALDSAISGITCTWDTDHFVITMPVGYFCGYLYSPSDGKDISGIGTQYTPYKWLNGISGIATITPTLVTIPSGTTNLDLAVTYTVGATETGNKISVKPIYFFVAQDDPHQSQAYQFTTITSFAWASDEYESAQLDTGTYRHLVSLSNVPDSVRIAVLCKETGVATHAGTAEVKLIL